MSMAQLAAGNRAATGIEGWAQAARGFVANRAAMERMTPIQRWAQMATAVATGNTFSPRSVSRSQVISPGPTQVIRPSAQAPQRRAAAPQAGASSSLITSTPSPAEVALATTTLLGG
jgi:hypothetical protein